MRISDWSSDVCSSDLLRASVSGDARPAAPGAGETLSRYPWPRGFAWPQPAYAELAPRHRAARSGRPCRQRRHLDAVDAGRRGLWGRSALRSEEHTSELQSLMRISYAVFCLTKKIIKNTTKIQQSTQT